MLESHIRFSGPKFLDYVFKTCVFLFGNGFLFHLLSNVADCVAEFCDIFVLDINGQPSMYL